MSTLAHVTMLSSKPELFLLMFVQDCALQNEKTQKKINIRNDRIIELRLLQLILIFQSEEILDKYPWENC